MPSWQEQVLVSNPFRMFSIKNLQWSLFCVLQQVTPAASTPVPVRPLVCTTRSTRTSTAVLTLTSTPIPIQVTTGASRRTLPDRTESASRPVPVRSRPDSRPSSRPRPSRLRLTSTGSTRACRPTLPSNAFAFWRVRFWLLLFNSCSISALLDTFYIFLMSLLCSADEKRLRFETCFVTNLSNPAYDDVRQAAAVSGLSKLRNTILFCCAFRRWPSLPNIYGLSHFKDNLLNIAPRMHCYFSTHKMLSFFKYNYSNQCVMPSSATQTFATPGATAEASASQLGHYRHDPQQQYSQQQSWQLDQGNLPTSYSNVYNPSYVAGYDGGLYGSNK